MFFYQDNPRVIHARTSSFGKTLCDNFGQDSLRVRGPEDEQWEDINCAICLGKRITLPFVSFRRNPGTWGVIRRDGVYLAYNNDWAVMSTDKFITEFKFSKEEAQKLVEEINKKRPRKKGRP